MKFFTFSLLTFALSLTLGYANAQCPPGGAMLNSQAEISAFVESYPNCTEITGNLQIGVVASFSSNTNIVDVTGLEGISSISGNLLISGNNSLNSIHGLDQLTYVGGDVRIDYNDNLTNLTGLGKLETIDNSNEDFWLQISTNGGNTFTTIEEWNFGDEFVNNQRYNETVTIPGPFTSNTKLRIRCDASANGDQVYIDDILIEACGANTNNKVIQNPAVSVIDQKNSSIENHILKTNHTHTAGIIVSPNPFGNHLNIQLPENHQFHTVQLIDTNGRLLTSMSIQEQTYLDLQFQDKISVTGMLFLRFVSQNGVAMKKIMKL